jgi:hypothetical protein
MPELVGYGGGIRSALKEFLPTWYWIFLKNFILAWYRSWIFLKLSYQAASSGRGPRLIFLVMLGSYDTAIEVGTTLL